MSAAPQAPLILLVDDEPDILYTTQVLLSQSGLSVMTADDPRGAFDALEKRRPDLIVTDYMMPWMDGREFVERLRQGDGTRHIPVILVSAVTQDEGPWNACLRKPVEFATLLETIRSLLGMDRRGGSR